MRPSARKRIRHPARTLAAALTALCLSNSFARATGEERGHYLFDLAGCLACHTDSKNGGQPLAGGRALITPFGTYYSPNITADREHGIGAWSAADFVTALRHGRRRDGRAYFPVFPYTAYSGLSERDMLDIRAYILSLPAAPRPNRDHDTGMIFGNRLLAAAWQALFFAPKPINPDNRGAYLVEALGHCAECHTPRGWLGNLDEDRHLAGTTEGPEGHLVPNITPDQETGIGKWRADDLHNLFTMGLLPDGDFADGGMAEVITNTTGKWRKGDLAAVIDYLKSLPAVRNRVAKEKSAATGEW